MIIQTVIKTVLFCTIPKIINEIYEPVKDTLSSGYDAVTGLFSDDEVKEPRTYFHTKLTEQNCIDIIDVYRVNALRNHRDRLGAQELVELLNIRFNFNYSYSTYTRIWNGTKTHDTE